MRHRAMRPDRPVEFVGPSKDDLSSFPLEVKLVIGFALRRIQGDNSHPNAKPMKGKLRDVVEISAQDDSGKRIFSRIPEKVDIWNCDANARVAIDRTTPEDSPQAL